MYEDIFNQIMQKINALMAEGRIDQAVDLLDRAVYGFVERKDYRHAKDCYNKILAVNPLALSEIIRIGDFIERSVYESIDVEHKTTWTEFYKDLSREVIVDFYTELEVVPLRAGEALFRQRDINDRLFFIDSGNIGLYIETKFAKTLLTILSPGEFVGVEGFLCNSYCSGTAQAESPTVLRALKLSDYQQWPPAFNMLSGKINTMVVKQRERVSAMIKKTDIQRRRHERYTPHERVSVKVNFPAFNKNFQTELVNVSLGGAAVLGHIDSALFRQLLGSATELNYAAKNENVFDKSFKAEVVGVEPKYNHNYSVHLQFKNLLEPSELDTLTDRLVI